VGDGDMMEGITHEAASLAGHLRLGKLVWLYDDNKVSLDGPTSLAFTEDVGKRFEAYGWQVLRVDQGDTDLEAIDRALVAAKADTTRPSFIMVHTTIGYGSPHKAGSSEAHGAPLGADEVKLTKKNLGWDPDKQFYLPEEAVAHFRTAVERGAQAEAAWQKRFDAWQTSGTSPCGAHCPRAGNLLYQLFRPRMIWPPASRAARSWQRSPARCLGW
jgi:transketolase